MKALTTILFFFLAINANGQDTLLRDTAIAWNPYKTVTLQKPADRHFVVTFLYVDSCGYLKKREFGWQSNNPYPKNSDLVLKASDITGTKYKDIYIVGVDTIGKADYEALFSKK